MGFQLADGTKLALDVAFSTPDGVQRPANWLRLSTPRDRELAGITEVAEPAWYDQRFYWGVDNPKDLDSLKTLWKSEQDDIAASLLNDSDKRVIKALDEATTFAEFKAAKPANYTTYRAAVRTACNTRQTEIDNCSDVAALKELLTGAAQIEQDGEMVANPNLATAWPDPVE
jgi:hypothetical protein|tara:strand:- start:14 stop:529 length:516 start_codon:yes stop_codon:yes gene_type:complete